MQNVDKMTRTILRLRFYREIILFGDLIMLKCDILWVIIMGVKFEFKRIFITKIIF